MGPLVIPAVIAAAQIGKGLLDSAKGKKQMGQAEALHKAIPQQDPMVRSHLDGIIQRNRYAESGASRMLAVKRRMIDDAGNQAGANLTRVAGTSPGSAQQAMLRNQSITQRSLAQAGAESEQLAPRYLAMQTPLISDIADRSLSLQTYLRDSNAMQGAQRMQNGSNQIMGGIGLASGLGLEAMGQARPKSAAYTPNVGVMRDQITASLPPTQSSPASVSPNALGQGMLLPENYAEQSPAAPQPGFAWYGGGRPSWMQ